MLNGNRGFSAMGLAFWAFFLCFGFASSRLQAQASGTIEGTVEDPSGAAIPGASVQILNPVSRFEQTARTDTEGRFRFPNVPFNQYHVTVKAEGFSEFSQDAEVR